MEEDITILEQPAETDGITEIATDPLPVALMRKIKAVKIGEVKPPVPEPPKEILWEGRTIYARDKALYYESNMRATIIAQVGYHYLNNDFRRVLAAAMMHGDTPVFAATQADLDLFKEMLLRVTVTAQPGQYICFFPCLQVGVNVSEQDNVVAICYDGVTIRYSDRVSGGGTIRLINPVKQPAAEIFGLIQKFVQSTVKDTSKQLAQARADIAEVNSRREEEAFNYLSELPEAGETKDIRDFVVAAMERAYVESMRMKQSYLANIASYERKIKDARSQLPSGRKGVPIRNAYLTAPSLSDMLDCFELVKSGSYLHVRFWFRKDLVCEGISFGRPIIKLTLTPSRSNGRHNTHVQGMTGESADLKAFLHPHLNGTASWCLGTYVTPLNNALLGGNIPMAASLLWQYLTTYNAESPLVQLDTCRQQMASARPRNIVVRRI